MRKQKRKKKDRVFLDVVETFRAPIYKNEAGKLKGPLTRTFRTGSTVKAVKITETKGNLHADLGKGYLSFNIPIASVAILR